MFSNKSYFVSFIFLLLAFQIACGQSLNVPKNNERINERVEALKKQADELVTALNKNDFDTFIELTDPKVIEKVGGRENFISIMKKVVANNPKIFESVSTSVGAPNAIVESEGLLFGVVPQKIEGITHKRHKVISNDCVVGVSSDNGKNWKFVSGEKFGEIFPSSKDKLQIITRETFVDGVRQ